MPAIANRAGRGAQRHVRVFAAVAALTLVACGKNGDTLPPATPIGLSSSLPLLWRESGDIRGQLVEGASRHWALDVLRTRGRVVPVDTLADLARCLPPRQSPLLVLVQPGALSAQENVALDGWLRDGGRLLLFADPMLTAESTYSLGDPRRPQAIAMLSPILRHWGLEPEFDAGQPAGERPVSVLGATLPVALPGRFRVRSESSCRLSGGGIAAECAIGQGRAIVVADAALFDGEDGGRSAGLAALLDHLTR